MIPCPYCSKEIEQNVSVCPHCKKATIEEVGTNWKAQIEQVERGYEMHKGLVHGLQKDAIQNGWGHRLHKKGKEWKFVFELIKSKKLGLLLAMTDYGGHGLTGQNLATNEIPDELGENERLGRFEHMFFSGFASQSAGLFGRGKLIFQAASKDYYIIYDSLTVDRIYRLNRRMLQGRRLYHSSIAYEGEDAKKMLNELTGGHIKPLESTGTRIIIVNPKDIIVEDINNGTFLKYIEETWWKIIQKYGDYIGGIYVKTEKDSHLAKIPKEFKNVPTGNEGKWKVRLLSNLPVDEEGILRIKKLHFIVNPDRVPPETRGIYLYRRDMKIADLEVSGVPDEINDKFYGYVEIEKDSKFEDKYLEQEIEGAEHYSINKHRGLIRNLRKTVQLEFDKFKSDIGFGVSTEGMSEERTARILKESLAELHKRMGQLGISVGVLKQTKDITVRLESIRFPSGGNLVNLGDIIDSITFKIENKSNLKYDLNVSVLTKDSQGNQIDLLKSQQITLENKGSDFIGPLSLTIAKEKYPEKTQIHLSCIVANSVTQRIIASRNIVIYITQRPEVPLPQPIELELEQITFPLGHANRRVDYGQAIKNIEYTVTNNLAEQIKARFKLNVLDAKKPNITIQQLYETDILLDTLKTVTVTCPDIEVNKENYCILEEEKGEVILRATIVALENSPSKTFEKSDKLAKSDMRFWVNQDSGKGVFVSTRDWEGGPDEPKSKVQPEGQSFIFLLNRTHPAYETLPTNGDDSAKISYTYEQMVRQTLYLLLLTNKERSWPDIEGKPYKANIISGDVEKYQIIESCLNTIDYLYAGYFK